MSPRDGVVDHGGDADIRCAYKSGYGSEGESETVSEARRTDLEQVDRRQQPNGSQSAREPARYATLRQGSRPGRAPDAVIVDEVEGMYG